MRDMMQVPLEIVGKITDTKFFRGQQTAGPGFSHVFTIKYFQGPVATKVGAGGQIHMNCGHRHVVCSTSEQLFLPVIH